MSTRPSRLSRPSRPSPHRAPRRLAIAAAAALLAACGASYSPPGEVALPPEVTTSAVAPVSTQPCENDGTETRSYEPLASLPAPGDMPAGTHMRAIQERGTLIVGTSIDTNLFSAVDPSTNTITGFDVDMATFVAQAIFGGTLAEAAERLDLRGITYAQRIPEVRSGNVDLVAHTMTINCARWQQVAFSDVYFNAGQKLLVAADSAETEVAEGQTVCVSAGGTSAEEMRDIPGVEVVEVNNQTDCVVLFQRGEADVIRSDDTVLAGFAAQDPYAKVVGSFLTREPYGMAMSLDHPEFTQFVNTVLVQAKADPERWQASYDRWLEPALQQPAKTIVLGQDAQELGVPEATLPHRGL